MLARAAVSRAASHDERRRAGRRRRRAASRRDLARASRRPVPRRARRMGPARPRGVARAARVGCHPHIARGAPEPIPGAIPAGRGDEPLPLRLARSLERALRVYAGPGVTLPQARVRRALRPDRHVDRGAGARGAGHGTPCSMPALERNLDRPRARRAGTCEADRTAGQVECPAAARRGRAALRAVGARRAPARAGDVEAVPVRARAPSHRQGRPHHRRHRGQRLDRGRRTSPRRSATGATSVERPLRYHRRLP